MKLEIIKMKSSNSFEFENWCKFDFLINKHYWENQDFYIELAIRNKNIVDLTKILKKYNIEFWLQGRTLLGIYQYGKLLKDHDDDIGLWIEDFKLFQNEIITELLQSGFSIIRITEGIVSFIRDDRYIDICLFYRKKKKVGYEHKLFPEIHFNSFVKITYNGEMLYIPQKTDKLLKVMYNNGLLSKTNKIINILSKKSNYRKLYKLYLIKLLTATPHSFRRVYTIPLKIIGLKYEKISNERFLETLIEPIDSFNWKWRKKHLDLVTNNGQNQKIGDIVQFLKNPNNLNDILAQVKETDTLKPFSEPSNLDKRFWHSGNNFFFYCIYFEFRKDVHPYSIANKYINEINKPALFSSDYYESLKKMSDDEINKLLKKTPVEITNGAFTGGKHRAFAMIGRLISGKNYIPFWALTE